MSITRYAQPDTATTKPNQGRKVRMIEINASEISGDQSSLQRATRKCELSPHVQFHMGMPWARRFLLQQNHGQGRFSWKGNTQLRSWSRAEKPHWDPPSSSCPVSWHSASKGLERLCARRAPKKYQQNASATILRNSVHRLNGERSQPSYKFESK
jgi:hypothetical protein